MPRSRYEQQIRKVLEERRQETAVDFDGVPFTWDEAQALGAIVEEILDAAGLAETDKVGLMGRNRPAHFVALWAVFVSGRCLSMVQAFQPPESLAADLAANRWPLVIGERRDWTPEVIAAADAAGTVGYAFTGAAAAPLERVTLAAQPGPRADRRPDDEAVLQLLSSGTTGKPKRITLSRVAVDEMIERTIRQFELAGSAGQGTQILPWPIFSLGGANGALPAAALGQQLAIQEKFNAQGMLGMIRRYRPSFLSIPPAALGMLLQLKPSREDLACVKLFASGTTALDPNVRRTLAQDYGVPVAEFYGATEFAGIISGWAPADMALLEKKRGSVGRALSGIQIRIVANDTGEPLPFGQSGLVEALVPRIGPHWVRTNDLAHMDEDGFLYLEGRADDAILRGGFKVMPLEVEEALRTHPQVGDAAVIGIADGRVGMVPAAVIARRVGVPAPTAQELEGFLRSKLAAYKVPARFAIVDDIPRTETMKPRREGLRALFDHP